MGYTALRDKPEKEIFLLGKDILVSGSLCSDSDSMKCYIDRLRVLVSSGSEQQHSKHHFMAVKSIYESCNF